MPPFDAPRLPPPERAAEDLHVPERLDLTFEGWRPEVFALLERLRDHPHVEQYRKEKEEIRRWLTEPFRRYRDDLVVNFVLPNQLGFETERNVFSRLLKNDFGAGGCHHHLWMSFYRPGRRRLTDFQLPHSLSPDGLTLGLYVGDHAQDLVRQSRERILDEPLRFLDTLAPLLRSGTWRFFVYAGAGGPKAELQRGDTPADLKQKLKKADGLWLRTHFARADVLAWGSGVVRRALEATVDVWPVYQLLAQ